MRDALTVLVWIVSAGLGLYILAGILGLTAVLIHMWRGRK